MKKLLPILFLFLYTMAHGQSAPKSAFSAGLDLAIPTNSIYSVGLGASGKAEIPITSAASITVTAGYTSLYYKKSQIGSSRSQDAAGFVPLKAGVKYYLSEGFFIEGELGTAMETNYSKNKLFAFALGPGFLLPVSKNTAIELGFRYENWGSGRVRQTGIRVAYHFTW
jgi:opacity protein-like surface antigen